MKVVLLSYTKDADRLCGVAALGDRSEYSSFELYDNPAYKEALVFATDQNHMGIVEHAVFTFSISRISRALTHQLVRHRIASFDQQSQRPVKLDKVSVVTPPTIKKDKKALSIYNQIMEFEWSAYNKLMELGIEPEDSRFVLPNACTTNITVTMNARSLIHFFKLRCCLAAQWEIRELACEMLKLCKEVSPIIFRNAGPPCINCDQPNFNCDVKDYTK